MDSLADISSVLKEVNSRMVKTEEALKHEFNGLRTGRASAALVESIQVDYYGARTPINQMGSINCPEPRQIVIQPWDATALDAVSKAIQDAQIGVTPVVDGNVVRISIPELTDERRTEITKVAKKYAEECRVSVRSVRKEANDAIKKLLKDSVISEDESKKAQEDVQKATDSHIKNIDTLLKRKEDEIHQI